MKEGQRDKSYMFSSAPIKYGIDMALIRPKENDRIVYFEEKKAVVIVTISEILKDKIRTLCFT